VWVWRFDNDVWTEDPVLVNPIDPAYSSAFGRSIAFYGATGTLLLVGAPQVDTVTESEPEVSYDGQAYIFKLEETEWVQASISPLVPSDAEHSQFGSSVAVSENGKVVVGGPYSQGAQGAVWTFDITTGDEVTSPATHAGSFNSNIQLGTTVAIDADGSTLITGVPYDLIDVGGFHTFEWNTSSWSHVFFNQETTNVYQAYEGKALAISRDGSTVVMGAFENQFYMGGVWIFQ
jgi:hypothetical protein